MNSINNNFELGHLFNAASGQDKPNIPRFILRGIALIAVTIVFSIVLVMWSVNERTNSVLTSAQNRTDVLASTRAAVLSAWSADLGSAGYRLSRSNLFKLFAADANDAGPVSFADTSLGPQLPYMVQAVSDLASQEQLVGAYLIISDGRTVLASGGSPELSDSQRANALKIFATRERSLSPAHLVGNVIVADVMLPITASQPSDDSQLSAVSGVLLLSIPLDSALRKALEPMPLMTNSEHTYLLQFEAGRTQLINPDGIKKIGTIDSISDHASGSPLRFAERTSIASHDKVFSSGMPVAGTQWLIIQENAASAVLEPVRSFKFAVIGFAILAVLAFIIALGAIWWRELTDHANQMATLYRDLAYQINEQRRFLESLMSTLHELVSLKKPDGSYAYVNPAFGRAAQRSGDKIVGLDDAAIFGRDAAESLRKSDDLVLAMNKPVMFEEELFLAQGRRDFEFSKVPYRDDKGVVAGILSVARDITTKREDEKKRQRAIQKMTEALVLTIEHVDPFLAGHTHHVREFCALLVSRLQLSPEQAMTLDIAANLAQIGKLVIPKDIVAKAGRLTQEEDLVMQTHVSHALEILKDVEFELPVLDTIEQFHERLDGSGYPKGLVGDVICPEARILGVCDTFCARIGRRSYRSAISPDEALSVLEENSKKYDVRIVAELRKIVESPEGEKLIAQIRRQRPVFSPVKRLSGAGKRMPIAHVKNK